MWVLPCAPQDSEELGPDDDMEDDESIGQLAADIELELEDEHDGEQGSRPLCSTRVPPKTPKRINGSYHQAMKLAVEACSEELPH